MTNLEFYKDELKECIKNNAREIAMVHRNVGNGFSDFSKKYINYYPSDSVAFVDWLLQEHKEPIKLKQWEYDLLASFREFAGDQVNELTLDNTIIISPMLIKGHFKGVTDTSMTIYEIIENCEVVDD